MSETLRDLVVSLSLNSDNFSRNIQSVTRQIQEAESGFKLAGAGVKDFESTTGGLSAKLETLERKLSLQKSAVDQYERALAAANKKLEESVANNDKVKASLEANRAKYKSLSSQIELARVSHEVWNNTLGEGHEGTKKAKAALDALEKEYADLGAEIKKNEGQLVATQKAMQTAADGVSKAQTNLNNAKAALKETEAAIKQCTTALRASQSVWTSFGKGMEKFGKSAKAASKGMQSIGRDLNRYVTAPLTALGGYALKSSVEFEEAFAGVKKTVKMTAEEYEKLDDALKHMTLVKPADYKSIAFVAETAGQLGIAKHAVEGFTSVMADLGAVSTDLSSDRAATVLAKMANILGVTQENQTTEYFQRMGSTVLELGINSATTEAAIVEMAMRLAAAGKQVGLTEAQILSFATGLSSVGIEAQAGGTAFSKALINMEVACVTGNKQFAEFAKISGMTSDAFKKLFKSDPAAAFQAFIAGLAKLDDEGKSTINTLNDLGFKEVRLRDTTLRTVNAHKMFTDILKLGNKAWAENTAITDLVNERYNTTAKRLEMLKNKTALTASTFGEVMLPTLEDLMRGASRWLDKLMMMDEAQRKQVVSTGMWAAAAGPAISTLAKFTSGVGTLSENFGKFASKVGKAGGGLKGFASVIGSSKLAVLGLTAALGVGAYLLWDWASGARAAREALEGMNATAYNWRHSQAKTLYSNEGLSFFGLSKDNFVDSMMMSKKWLADMIDVWSDGKKETDVIVSGFTDSFTAMTEKTKTALAEMRETAKDAGHAELAGSIQNDMDRLDKVNSEIAKLLKKKQNKNLSEKDKVRLQELIDTKEAIEVKYKLTPEETGGYAQILQGIETEIARSKARGEKRIDVSIYEKGLTAAAHGHAAVTREIDRQYDAEYALIQLIEDEEARAQARFDLDEKYKAQRTEAAQEYANTIRELIGPVWEQDGIQKASQDMDGLMALFREYSTLGSEGYKDPEILKKMQELTDGMDKDQLLNYLGILQQVQALLDSGMTETEVKALFPDIDFTSQLDQFAALADFARDRSGELQGLSDILNGIVPEEMKKLAVELDMTAVEARWAEFASNPGAITTEAIILGYSDAPEVTVPDATVDALVQAYKEIEGGASTVQLTPDDVVAQVASYLESQGADISALKPDQVEAIVNAYSEATGANKDDLLKAFTAKIASYDDTNAIKPKTQLTAKIAIVGYDLASLNAFRKNHPVEVTGIVRLGEQYSNPEDVLNDPNAKFYLNGKQIEVDVVPRDRITADTLFVYDEDGTMHVLVTPKIQGTPESADEAAGRLHEGTTKISTAFGGTRSMGSNFLGGIFNSTISENMDMMIWSIKWFLQNRNSIADLWGLLDGTNIRGLNSQLDLAFVAEDWAAIHASVQEAITVLNNEGELSESAIANLQKLQEMVSLMEAAGIGQNIVAGIGDAMTQAGWESDAETVAGNLEAALNKAMEINSPSKLVMPVGTGVAEGVAEGMTTFSFDAPASALAFSLTSALRNALPISTMKSIGLFAMSGLAIGILSGRASVVAAIKSVARAAVVAAKAELVINSPSGVFRDEVGRMITRGMGQGALLESKNQAKVIANAARYLTGAAQGGVYGMIASDNRRTITNNANSQVTVQNLYVRDERDIHSIAVEIAQLTRRRQAAIGARA